MKGGIVEQPSHVIFSGFNLNEKKYVQLFFKENIQRLTGTSPCNYDYFLHLKTLMNNSVKVRRKMTSKARLNQFLAHNNEIS